MKVERLEALPLTKAQALEYARIVVEQCMNKTAKKTSYAGGGSFGRAVSVECTDGKKLVVKFLRAPDMLEKETHDLTLLAKYCTAKMPAVLFTRPCNHEIPVDCYGMENIEGKSALFTFGMLLMSKKRRMQFADCVTSALHTVHYCKNEKFGDTMNADCDTWLDYYRPFAAEVLQKAEEYYASGKLNEKIILAMRAAWSKFDVIFSEEVR